MCNFCYYNIVDIYKLIQDIYYELKINQLIETLTSFNINSLNSKSSFGEQIKYYRKLKNIRIKKMIKVLNIGYNTIIRIENLNDNNYKFNSKGIEIINKIIDYLDIRDKINYNNNEYLDFVLNKQEEIIKKLFEKDSIENIAKKMKVSKITIIRWMNNESIPSKENYLKIAKLLYNSKKIRK